MTGTVLLMHAYVAVTEGARVRYDCPMRGEDFKSTQFFDEHRGKVASVVGFSKEYVGPLDQRGRVPGVYVKPNFIDVQFDGEACVHKGLNIHHFVLLDVAQTVIPQVDLDHQKVGDLPEAIQFWPGDQVYKQGEQPPVARFVQSVRIGEGGIPVYALAETVEERQRREEERSAQIRHRREEAGKRGDATGLFFVGLGSSKLVPTDFHNASDLELVLRGNVYHLYNNPKDLSFPSLQYELAFWAREGISTIVYGSLDSLPRSEWSLGEAKRMVQDGLGDLVVLKFKSRKSVIVDPVGDYKVRMLHPCFASHRDWVRKLSLDRPYPPMEEDPSFGTMIRFTRDN